jgi:cell pole-organizing protein PopZ
VETKLDACAHYELGASRSPNVETFAENPRPQALPAVSTNVSRQTPPTHLVHSAFALRGRHPMEPSLDDLVRELLHPLLTQWLNQHLPRIVEQLVNEEITRRARPCR